MKNVIFLFGVLLLASATFAGTPPVKELKLLSPNRIIEMYANNSIPNIEIGSYGENESAVIPSEWYCEPGLPEGLEIVRGEGADNSKLYIKGIPEKANEYQQYTIFALNNGNKVKKIDAAFTSIDIVIHEEKNLYFERYKFFVAEARESVLIIDAIHDKKLGSFELPFHFKYATQYTGDH